MPFPFVSGPPFNAQATYLGLWRESIVVSKTPRKLLLAPPTDQRVELVTGLPPKAFPAFQFVKSMQAELVSPKSVKYWPRKMSKLESTIRPPEAATARLPPTSTTQLPV